MPQTAIKARPCGSCGVLVYDLIHEGTRRPAPIEVDPSPEGNIAIDLAAGTYRVVGLDMRRRLEAQRHLNHFASCAFAKRYRPKK